MRIISKFHDFYDSVQNQGIDKDCLYLRESKVIKVKSDFELGYRNYGSNGDVVNFYLLGFCGEIYYLISSYNLKTGVESIEIFNKNEVLEKFKQSKRRFLSYINKELKFAQQDETKIKELFHTYQVPIFLISLNKEDYKTQLIELNPSLKKYNFQKIKDPFNAFQQIYQYVSGVLNKKENNMINISNEDKIAKHGFDQWSFRKQSKEKKNVK